MFGGRLPEVAIELCDVKTFLGQLCYKTLPDHSGRIVNSDFKLKISTRYDLEPAVLDDVIIHEMIHYFIALHQLEDSSKHGNIFRAIMHSINATHRRNISISHRTTPGEASISTTPKRSWHVIAIITMRAGEQFVKVLPRVVPKVIDFHRKLKLTPGVKSIDLYLHDNPYFNRYPTSTALKIYKISTSDIEQNIKGAHRLTIQGNKIIQS